MVSTNAELLELGTQHAVISVVGCQGKTTFIRQMASALQCQDPAARILITTTTKIRPIQENGIPLLGDIRSCQEHQPVAGIQCMGLFHGDGYKLGSLPLDILQDIANRYDYVLIEADGSKDLPCKGWRDDEPVILPCTTHTVGIVTLDALDKKANEHTVLRMPLFSKLTGIQENQTISLDALVRMLIHPQGMFWNAIGHTSVLVNKIDSLTQRENVAAFLAALQQSERFDLLAYGSAQQNQFATWDAPRI